MTPHRIHFPTCLPDAAIVVLDDGGLRVVRTSEVRAMRDFDEARAAVEGGAPEPLPTWHERAVRIVAGLLHALAAPAPLSFEEPARVRVYDGWPGDPDGRPLRPSRVHAAVAGRGLALAAKRDPGRWSGALDDDEARDRLALAVARDLARFHRSVRGRLDAVAPAWRRLDDGQPVAPWEAVEVELDAGGALWLDEEGAAWLEGTGAAGRELAAKMRASSTKRADVWRKQLALPGCERGAGALWRAWYKPDADPTPCPWAHNLALALWLDEVGEPWRVERDREAERLDRERRTHAPALVGLFQESWSRLSSSPSIAEGRLVVGRSSRDTGLYLAPAVDLDALQLMAASLHKLPARRTMHWYAWVAWRVFVEGGTASGDGWRAWVEHSGMVHVVVEGGHERLAALVGEVSKNNHRAPFDTMKALSSLHRSLSFDGHDLNGAVVAMANYRRGSRAGPGRIEVTLSRWWSGDAVQVIPKGSRDRVLVPVLDVPPMDGIAEVHQPGVAALEEGALVYLARHSEDLVKRDGVRIPWADLAHARDVPNEVQARAVEAWRTSERWRRTTAGWRLGECDDNVRRAHDLLVEGGTMKVSGSKGGTASAAKKRKTTKNAR